MANICANDRLPPHVLVTGIAITKDVVVVVVVESNVGVPNCTHESPPFAVE
jgi:hypothetical protein